MGERSSKENLIFKLVYTGVSEVQAISANTKNNISDFFDHYFFISGLYDENILLKEENSILKSQNNLLTETVTENERLKNLLEFKNRQNFNLLPVQIIAKDFISNNHLIVINKGSSHGIKKYMGIIHPQGVVGYVFRTSPNSSQVITILNKLSSMLAINQRSRTNGLIESHSSKFLVFKHFSLTNDFEKGDSIVSQKTDHFPSGLNIGTIEEVQRKNKTSTVIVKPQVAFSALEEVLVILNTKKSNDTN